MGAIGSAGLGNNAPTRTVVDFGYESVAGVSIEAGAVPAPGALALLGVAGLAGKRRRR
jgi:MYXO-CTERM domain-containing protein